MPESLQKKTVNGMVWSFLDNLINYGVAFLVGIVLARLLSPKEYGLIGIITIFIVIFNSIVDSGFSTALIRKKGVTHTEYNTVFIFNLVISVVLFSVLFLAAPFISQFFDQPELIPLLRVMGSIVIINAFTIIQRTQLTKKIDFKTQTKISLISSVISGAVGIVMAIFGFGVWSLAFQQISKALINTILLWIYNKTWHFQWEFSWNSFRELFNFGWKIMVVNLIASVWEEVYQVVIGKCYSTETLGYFTKANQFRGLFSRNIASVINRVSYPVLSTINDDDERLKQSFRKIIKCTTLISFVLLVGMTACAHPMIVCLIGEQWIPAVVFLEIICFSGLWNPLQILNINMLQVQGKSGLLLKFEIVKRALALIPVLLGIFIDIKWMLWGSVFTNFLIFCCLGLLAGRGIHYTLKEQLKDILPSAVISGVMGLIVYAMSFIPLSAYLLFPLQIIIGALVVVLICESLKINEYQTMKGFVVNSIQKIKHRNI